MPAAETYRPLEGRLALITGASRGLGAATARQLAAWGARIVVTYRREAETAEAVVAECAARTPGAYAVALDLTEEDSVREAFGRLVEAEERLDLLIANAAATAFRPLMEMQLHHIDKTFSMTVRHFLLMIQLAYPLLERAGGRVVAISGADTVTYVPRHGLLGAAKASMEMLVKYLGCELAPKGMSAVAILPGYIETDSMKLMTAEHFPRIREGEILTSPMRRAVTPEEAAEAVAVLCLDEARWFNGQVVQSDAGGLFAMFGRYMQVQATGGQPLPEGGDGIIGV